MRVSKFNIYFKNTTKEELKEELKNSDKFKDINIKPIFKEFKYYSNKSLEGRNCVYKYFKTCEKKLIEKLKTKKDKILYLSNSEKIDLYLKKISTQNNKNKTYNICNFDFFVGHIFIKIDLISFLPYLNYQKYHIKNTKKKNYYLGLLRNINEF
uniref:Uncharacterized protein n=1 Tax=viral metagenome TaxID=1070528 RepID=A0A6C0ACI3_9ZZZZ